MVSGPLHETTHGRPATAIRIPVVLCGAPAVEPKPSPRRRGLDASTDRGLTERSGEVFLLDILSHGMSEMTMFQQQLRFYEEERPDSTSSSNDCAIFGLPEITTQVLCAIVYDLY